MGDPKGGGPEGAGPNPEKVGARRVGARRVGAKNFALFFPLPLPDFSLFSLSEGLLVDLRVWAFLGSFGASPGGPRVRRRGVRRTGVPLRLGGQAEGGPAEGVLGHH